MVVQPAIEAFLFAGALPTNDESLSTSQRMAGGEGIGRSRDAQ